MQNRAENPQSAANGTYALRVTRIEPGQSMTFRLLSNTYGGVLTHWIRNRSAICPGKDECLSTSHRTPLYWKGYVSCDLWVKQTQKWYPTVLELTEHSELDLRGLTKRGQLWEFSRAQQKTAHRTPVVAKYLETRDPSGWSPPHDLQPVLRTLYHVDFVDATRANPMPAKCIVMPSDGEGPTAGQGAAEETPVSAAAVHELVKSWRRRMETKGVDQ